MCFSSRFSMLRHRQARKKTRRLQPDTPKTPGCCSAPYITCAVITAISPNSTRLWRRPPSFNRGGFLSRDIQFPPLWWARVAFTPLGRTSQRLKMPNCENRGLACQQAGCISPSVFKTLALQAVGCWRDDWAEGGGVLSLLPGWSLPWSAAEWLPSCGHFLGRWNPN